MKEKKARKQGKELHVWRSHKKVAEEVGALRKLWKEGCHFDWYNKDLHRMFTVEVLRIKPYRPWVKIRLSDGTLMSVHYKTLFARPL